jgi:hypothetical protein
MRNDHFSDPFHEGDHHGEGHKRRRHHGAKTFRRGKVIAFLNLLQVKRAVIKQQVDEPEYQSIHQVLVGELKALDTVIHEFVQLFDIREEEVTDASNHNPNENN